MSRTHPINSAVRNAVWIYDAMIEPRFVGAAEILGQKQSHEMPEFNSLPEEANIRVELYNGRVTIRLDGAQRRIYIRRFEFVSFASDDEARYRFLTLWRELESLESVAEVERTAEEWLKKRK